MQAKTRVLKKLELKKQRVEAREAPPNASRYHTERFYPIRAEWFYLSSGGLKHELIH
jgi:hypothetical protein